VNINGRFITLIDLRKALTGEIVGELDEAIKVLSRQREPVTPAHAIQL
jgi:hypothetical protein